MDKVIADQFYANGKITVNISNDEVLDNKSILKDCFALFVRLNAKMSVDGYGNRKVQLIHIADIVIRWSYDFAYDVIELQITRPCQFLDICYCPDFRSKSENIEWKIDIWTSHCDIVESLVAILLLLI